MESESSEWSTHGHRAILRHLIQTPNNLSAVFELKSKCENARVSVHILDFE